MQINDVIDFVCFWSCEYFVFILQLILQFGDQQMDSGNIIA
jgi:hypothetical protein